MNKDYLPSKQFVKKVIILVALVAIVIFITAITPSLKAKLKSAQLKNVTVGDLVMQDSNNNGIPDWEEVLYGLDPKGNGATNKEFILAKQKAAADNATTDTSSTPNENDALSQQMLALIVSLQQSGNLTDAALNNIGASVGSQIVAAPIPDVYTTSMQTVVQTTPASITTYYKAFSALANKYSNKNIGDELTYISQAIANKDTGALSAAVQVGQAYHDFGAELIKIPVPTSLAVTDLDLANNYEKNSQAIQTMSQAIDDPLKGMTAIVQYKKYNDALLADLQSLQTFFVRNGILKSN